jgi:hypothetical protein
VNVPSRGAWMPFLEVCALVSGAYDVFGRSFFLAGNNGHTGDQGMYACSSSRRQRKGVCSIPCRNRLGIPVAHRWPFPGRMPGRW